ncbi:MAG: PrsW family glutamic-type intramembrane protease [Candidatus Pacebacteria bacterium]|nr:PrsW family glutamic-type intramembrane protease [Candidatus Paceibacterota bacterium]MDD5357452.1 PrsW family glutamic-type intramembrane protease [Candidatus Paceibacterota bacterium]
MINAETVFWAMLGGFIPALFWLWFWLREDTIHPEPRGLIVLAFFAGMIAAPLALPLEKYVSSHGFGNGLTFLLWAVIEESLKFFAAYVAALGKKNMNEPVNALIYLITAALGFSAIENTFFLMQPLAAGNIVETLLTGNLRFIGASLLHTVSSAMVGLFIALAFYKKEGTKKLYILYGLFFAIILHTLFNFFIIEGNNTFMVFAGVWMAVIVLMVFFEKVKSIRPSKTKLVLKTR